MMTTKRSSLQNIFLVLIILVMFSFLYELIYNVFFDYYFYLSFNISFRGLLGLISLYSWGVSILDGLGALLAGIVFWVFRPSNKQRFEDDAMIIFKQNGEKGGHAHG